ncbi:MAG TPA: SGNH/GDSL hydrolase family protein [Actinomycetes bacterium]|nr:SGNH/GDSL hydrolase family protein [Actinomycetes bacterium]
MSRASRARAVAQAAAVGGAGLVGVGGAFYGLLLGQSKWARRRIGVPTERPPDPPTSFGGTVAPIRLALFGDSAAAGFGVSTPDETTGALLAAGLSQAMRQAVELRCFAVVGAQSGDLGAQVEDSTEFAPQLAVIMVGANDVTHRVTPGRSVALLTAAVTALRELEAEVVVGTCPDLGTVRPIPHPLKWVARRWSRSLAAAQTVAVVEAGGRTVALADLLGAEFDAHPDQMFGPDQFHPSAAGYRALAAAVVPSLVAALTEPAPGDVPPPSVPIDQAAAAAAEVGGTEVVAATSQPALSRWGRKTLRVVLRQREDEAEGQPSVDADHSA